jgi:hypothetical protein
MQGGDGTLGEMHERQLPPRAPSLSSTASAAIGGAVARRLLRCIGSLFWLKAVGITAFMWLFFVGYFQVLRHPVRAAVEMPLTAVDQWIAFQPWALWPYISLWFYVVVPPSLMTRSRALVQYGVWIGGLCLVGLVCFYAWPTAVPRPVLSVEGLTGFELLHGVDATGNACPSLHVAAATFSALWIHHLVRTLALPRWWRVVNALWFVLIVWSTMATRQHVWWDVVAGLALALVLAPPSMRWVEAPRAGDIMAPAGKQAGGER